MTSRMESEPVSSMTQRSMPMPRPPVGGIAFGMEAGVFLTVVGMLFTPQILQWMGTPEDVMPQSVAYIRTYFAGSIGLVMYNQCRGVMQAVGDSRHPLYYLSYHLLHHQCGAGYSAYRRL